MDIEGETPGGMLSPVGRGRVYLSTKSCSEVQFNGSRHIGENAKKTEGYGSPGEELSIPCWFGLFLGGMSDQNRPANLLSYRKTVPFTGAPAA